MAAVTDVRLRTVVVVVALTVVIVAVVVGETAE